MVAWGCSAVTKLPSAVRTTTAGTKAGMEKIITVSPRVTARVAKRVATQWKCLPVKLCIRSLALWARRKFLSVNFIMDHTYLSGRYRWNGVKSMIDQWDMRRSCLRIGTARGFLAPAEGHVNNLCGSCPHRKACGGTEEFGAKGRDRATPPRLPYYNRFMHKLQGTMYGKNRKIQKNRKKTQNLRKTPLSTRRKVFLERRKKCG